MTSVEAWNLRMEGHVQWPIWRGRRCFQFESDLFRYAEICWAYKPELILEIGTAHAGTTLFLADVCDLIGDGRIVTVDLDHVELDHPRVAFVQGDSTSEQIYDAIYREAQGARGLVLLDGDHHAKTVRQELELYSPLADVLIVQDTLMEHLPSPYCDMEGPADALRDWLEDQWDVFDRLPNDPEPTQHPLGWLRRRMI